MKANQITLLAAVGKLYVEKQLVTEQLTATQQEVVVLRGQLDDAQKELIGEAQLEGDADRGSA